MSNIREIIANKIVLGIIEDAKERISDKSRWTRGSMGRNVKGNRTSGMTDTTTSWCALGSLHNSVSLIMNDDLGNIGLSDSDFDVLMDIPSCKDWIDNPVITDSEHEVALMSAYKIIMDKLASAFNYIPDLWERRGQYCDWELNVQAINDYMGHETVMELFDVATKHVADEICVLSKEEAGAI